MNHIIHTPNELDLLQQDKLVVVRPLKEQPPEGYEPLFGVVKDDGTMTFKDIQIHRPPINVAIPFTPGQKLVVKETWRIANVIMSKDGHVKVLIDYVSGGEKIWKQTESRNLEGWMNNGYYRWYIKYSPVTMPQWASRFTVVAGEPVVKRVQELTFNEILRITDTDTSWMSGHNYGIARDINENFSVRGFKIWWNSLYAKPRKRGDHYECWPWRLSDTFAYNHDFAKEGNGYVIYNKDGITTYPLTIHSNPYVVMFEAERKAG